MSFLRIALGIKRRHVEGTTATGWSNASCEFTAETVEHLQFTP